MDTSLHDKRSLRALIVYIKKRVPLPLKMTLMTIVLGLVVWAVLDHIQTNKLKNIFQAQLAERLSKQAMEDRLSFDRYVKVHHQLVRLFVTQNNFSNYIENKDKEWSTEDVIQIRSYMRIPLWFPNLSVLRTFAKPRYALLLDSQGKVREVYESRRQQTTPQSLLQTPPLLLAKSHGQSFLTGIDATPYLVASESLFDSYGGILATLMIASPIDEEFLTASLGPFIQEHKNLVALLTPGGKPQILTSNNLAELPIGTPLEILKKRYLITGTEFFDYGASDLSITLASFISMAEIDALTKSVLTSEQQQRAIGALVFILAFALIIFWITKRIQKLTQRITDFSHSALGVKRHKLQKGDQIFILEDRFQSLTEDVLEARKALKNESEAHKYLALHDALTGLPNRALLNDRLEQAILAAKRGGKQLAVLMLDLDHFKEINDTLGHNLGDIVLKQLGARLLGTLRKSDTIARFGGDEFIVVLPSVNAEQATYLARKLLNALEPSFVVRNNNLHIGASIGIVLCPDQGEDPNILIQHADVAMYNAKQSNSGIANYNPDQDKYSQDRLVIIGELHHAIEHEELLLHYQPKVECKTNSITGVEALVRWQHPQHGLIFPDEFIPLTEHSGLIRQLTRWVINASLQQCAIWQRAGIKINVSVNLSTRNLQDTQLPEQIAILCKTWGINPEKLELEITESAMMAEPERAMEILTQLSTIGVRLSIDDFGIGYSSLAYLKRLPVNEIKIDKSFVMNMVADKNDAVIVRSTIELAHNLGLKVMAEGVDQQQIWDILRKIGCDTAQGYYISHPLPAEKLTDWLNSTTWRLEK